MKTPRLSLKAFLALAFATSALAAGELPTWTVIEEGASSWPTISFRVGSESRALQCRYAECGPNAPKKANINLYLLTKKPGATPTTVTTYDGVERSKWNPRRYTDGEYAYVPRKIKADSYNYDSELSYYKLDNTGAAPAVVQGSARYAATNSSLSAGYYGYDQMKVAPPKKMGDDEIKPAAPSAPAKTTWWCKQSTGEIIGVQPGHKPPEGYTQLRSRSSKCGDKPANGGRREDPRELRKLPTAGAWKDAVTPVASWRSVKTSAWPLAGVEIPVPGMNFYCYHEKMDGDKDLMTHLKKNRLIVECVNWTVPSDDATKDEGGKKFKIRSNAVVFDLGFVNGKLQTLNAIKGVIVTENSSLPDSLGGEKFVKVTAVSAPDAPAKGALSAKELTWLEKTEKGLYEAAAKPKEPAALAAHYQKYRDFIIVNLEPNTEAIGKYKAALADPKSNAAAIDATLPPVWGGDNKAVVGLFGPLTDIQLSKDEYDALAKLSKPGLQGPAYDYAFARGGKDGKGKDETTFVEANYDPIVLHKTVIKARAMLPKKPEVKPGDEISDAPLTDAEIALLTPDEKRQYLDAQKKAENGTPELKKFYSDLSRTLRKRIIDEKRGETAAYVPPKNLEEFKKLADWQKTKFCDPKSEAGAQAANSGPKQSDTKLNTGKDAKVTLGKVDAQLKAEAAEADQKAATQASGGLPDWAKGPCAEHLARMNPAPGNGNGGTTPPGNIAGKIEHGKDAEIKPKEANPWFTMELGLAAVKGGMVGLLVGSLFGPVGLVAGPLIGAAIFYGMTKLQS